MYQTGMGVKQNFAKAFSYYNEAAAKDFPQGYYGAGYLLYKGIGVKHMKQFRFVILLLLLFLNIKSFACFNYEDEWYAWYELPF